MKRLILMTLPFSILGWFLVRGGLSLDDQQLHFAIAWLVIAVVVLAWQRLYGSGQNLIGLDRKSERDTKC